MDFPNIREWTTKYWNLLRTVGVTLTLLCLMGVQRRQTPFSAAINKSSGLSSWMSSSGPAPAAETSLQRLVYDVAILAGAVGPLCLAQYVDNLHSNHKCAKKLPKNVELAPLVPSQGRI